MENVSNIDKLLEIARFLNSEILMGDIETLKKRIMGGSAELLIPLVGEFSSGKTSLIRVLMDDKQLETSWKASTATLYRIHFGCEKSCATIMNEAGEIEEVEDVASLKNETLEDAVVVDIYDTSSRVPATTILVDTPGLSSLTPKHGQRLVEIFPYADAILLIVDIGSQTTRSLTDFIDTIKLSNRPIYWVITQCDKKAKEEVEETRRDICNEFGLPIEHIACISANKNNMDELYALLETIQKDKDDILAKANEYRIKNIISELLLQIEELINNSTSDNSLDDAIRNQEYELRRLNNKIDRLVGDLAANVKDKAKDLGINFSEEISIKLERLVANKSNNFDQEALSLICNTSRILLEEYKLQILDILSDIVQKNRNTENDVPLHSLTEIDLSDLSINEISYNLNLNSLGHQYDGTITKFAKGAIVAIVLAGGWFFASAAAGGAAAGGAAAGGAAAGGAAAGGAAAGGAAAGGAAAGGAAAGGAAAGGVVAGLAAVDSATDLLSVASNVKTRKRMEKFAQGVQNAAKYANKNASEVTKKIESYDQSFGEESVLRSLVALTTDKLEGKRQRKYAVHYYMHETLLPCFEKEMLKISSQVIERISRILHNEAVSTFSQKAEALRALKKESNENKERFKQRIKQLKDYRTQLITFKN